MKINIVIILLLLFQIGCTKEKITIYKAFLKNTTNHEIKIIPYFSGITYSNKNVILHPGDSVKIGDGFDRGLVNHGGFSSEYLSGSDSLVVSFDNLYTITHYFTTPSTLSNKHYLYSSGRNLGNYLNWEYSYSDLSKNKREAIYLYKFIEQDFLDAK